MYTFKKMNTYNKRDLSIAFLFGVGMGATLQYILTMTSNYWYRYEIITYYPRTIYNYLGPLPQHKVIMVKNENGDILGYQGDSGKDGKV